MIQESELDKESLKGAVDLILNNSDKQELMKKNLATVSVDNSQTIIYEELKKLISK